MTIVLNHAIVPAHDKVAAAQWRRFFGLDYEGPHGPVRRRPRERHVHLLFDNQKSFETDHYAFHVSDAEFAAIFGRLNDAHLSFGSAPGKFDDGEFNHFNGGRGSISKVRMATYWS